MNEVGISQAAALFDDLEKWTTFFDLIAAKDQIVDIWYSVIVKHLKDKMNINPNEWRFRKWQPRSWGWHIGSDPDSLVILYENNNFCLWINESRYDVAAIRSQVNAKRLFLSFFEPSHIRDYGSYLAVMENAISINNIKSPDLLAWFAAHEGPEQSQLLGDLHSFFSHFICDPEMYTLITEVNTFKR